MIQSNLDRHAQSQLLRKMKNAAQAYIWFRGQIIVSFCQLQRKLGLFKKVFMLVALVNHSLCWRLVYTSGAPLITSLVSWGTQPLPTRVHNFKHFPSQALWISKFRILYFPCLAFVSPETACTISSIFQSHVNLSNRKF